MNIFGENIKGNNVDTQTKCAHYHTEKDIIALKFKCCEKWFPCYECHDENTAHQPEVWSKAERNAKAVLCGKCGYKLSIEEYFKCDAVCPNCLSLFNPKCADHYHLYFEM